ncbi:MAG: bifunctional DNA-formamidopyrimidine glycosylase/DNA-(apurinic or apyrimidinic site) lyase [bacterium]|jgi:formamidopyrimidine-DNA glycosylase|nr:bifunctional DNA-formamidopyrimidine glycosylase/DNA-(apurinic or apyrimidinic site) lyase [bacterium]
MPELPEVETIRRDLEKLVAGNTITAVNGSVVGKKKIVRTSWEIFKRELTGSRISAVQRTGKLLCFSLDTGSHLLVHLKMTGQLIYRKNAKIVPGGHDYPPTDKSELPNRYTHVWFDFSDRARLFFNDMRQFGYLMLADKKELILILDKLGLDALSNSLTIKVFRNLFKGRKAAIKSILLNQNLIAGIGNIYADEICFASGVRPDKRVSGLSRKKIDRLFEATRSILTEAIAWRGTTFSDYRDGEGRQGNYLQRLKVYGREGEPCLECKNGVITKTTVAGRGTSYCPRCQR